MDEPIITKSDILALWSQMDKNLKEGKIDPFTLRAQQGDLKPFLGAALYYDFITNLEDANYQTLFNGTEYTYRGNTIFFEGIKPLLCAYSFARISSGINISVGRAAVIEKDNENSTPHSNAIIQTRAREIKSEALRLQDETRQYLSQERASYPLWNQREDDSSDDDTSLFGMRVPRHRQR